MRKEWTLFLTFLKIGAFTFGGGYAMIALLENEFVERKKWIEKDDFLNMVAIAESTPGPVAINSATYIGYKIAGLFGAAAATVAVCIPSFTVIFCISLFFDQFLSFTWEHPGCGCDAERLRLLPCQEKADNGANQDDGRQPDKQVFERVQCGAENGGFGIRIVPAEVRTVEHGQGGKDPDDGQAQCCQQPADGFPPDFFSLRQL